MGNIIFNHKNPKLNITRQSCPKGLYLRPLHRNHRPIAKNKKTVLAATIAVFFSVIIGTAYATNFYEVIHVDAVNMGNLTIGYVDIAYDGKCSLVEAIRTANNETISNTDCGNPSSLDHVIELPEKANFLLNGYMDTADGFNGLPSITSTIIINGHGALIRRSSEAETPEFRIFHIAGNGNLTINQFTVSNGLTPYGSSGGSDRTNEGGGILNRGILTINRCSFLDNKSFVGGALVNLSGAATITDSRFANNSVESSGGAIVTNGGDLTLNNCTLSDNSVITQGTGGGAILVFGNTVTILNNCTLSDNSSAYLGGAISILNSGSDPGITLNNCTLSGNSAAENMGGGIYNDGARVTLANTIIANSSTNSGNCVKSGSLPMFIMSGHNLSDDNTCNSLTPGAVIIDNPNLGSLRNNGGATQTHALLNGSPAIDAGDDAICKSSPINNKDQRGRYRDQGLHCDIGAYELPQTTFFVIPTHNGKVITLGL